MRWMVFVNLTQNRHIWEEGISSEAPDPSEWPVGKFLGVFLTNGYRGKVQLTHL